MTLYLTSFLAYTLTLRLKFFLAFCLASILTFYLAFYLASILTFFLTFSGILFGRLSGIYSDILCAGPGVAHCIQSSRYSVRVHASRARDMARTCWCPQSRRAAGRGGNEEEKEKAAAVAGGSVAPLLKSRGPHLAGGEITGNTEHVRDGHRLLEIVKKHM